MGCASPVERGADAPASSASTAQPDASARRGSTGDAASSASALAPTASSSASSAGTSSSSAPNEVVGTIVAIRLQNVSKAAGRFNYNVELDVRGSVEGPAPFPMPPPPVLAIRIDKIYWGELDEPRQKALAPSGPEDRLTVSSYDRYRVGDPVRLGVRFSSPGLATLAGR
jgi:hypothetical protein